MINISNISNKNIETKSKLLFQFCCDNSAFVVLTRRHVGGVKKDILKEMIQHELLKIEKRQKVQIECTKNMTRNEIEFLGFNNRNQIINSITDQASNDRLIVESVSKEYKDKEDDLITKLKPYGLRKRVLSFGSFFTWPGIWDMCFFDISSINYTGLGIDFFTRPIFIGDFEFEDYGFANRDEVIWAKVCPHEEYFQFSLTERQFVRFKRLNIPYNIMSRERGV